MSARAVYELAPLGAIVRYSDGTPRPPERHVRKLRTWKRNNGQGRLVEKRPAYASGRVEMPASITLQEGAYTSEGVVVLDVRSIFDLGSKLAFEVVFLPDEDATPS